MLKSFDKALDASHGGVLLTDLRDDEEKENTEQAHGVGDERESRSSKNKKSMGNSYSDNNNESSIKEQIMDNYKILIDSEVVSSVTYTPMNKKQLHTVVSEKFKKIGYKIDRQNFGIVEIGEKQINKALNYLNTDGEKAAMLAIPQILKKGQIISGHNNHKGREYDTVTIGAKIEINTNIAIVGAVVTKIDNRNKYRVHRVLMPEGSELIFDDKKTDAEPTSGEPLPKDKRAPISSASVNIIPEKSRNVNSNERNSKKTENRGVNWNDLTEGTDIGKQAEDNSDIRVHPPAPKKKVSKNTESDKAPKVEPKKEAKKPKRPLKITKALTDDEAHNIIAYIMEDYFKGITEDTKMAYLPGTVRKDVQNRLTHIANTNDTEAYVGKVYEIAELICNEAVIREQYDVSDRYDLDEARRTIDILDSYKGKINLEAIREDIKSVYDTRAPHLVRTWGAKKTRGVSTDVIREELAEYGIKIDSP